MPRPAGYLCLALTLAALWFPASHLTSAQNAGAGDPVVALFQRGQDALAERHYNDALKAFKKVNELRGNSCGQCYLEMAVAQKKLGQLDDALKSCDKALQCVSTDPVRTATHVLKDNILESMGADPKKLSVAESEYRAALQLDANNAMIHFNLGVVLLREGHDPDGIAELNDYLRLLPGGPNASYAKKLIANPRRAGDQLALSFSVRTLDGQQISLDQLAGKIVVLDFWATWCGPCRESVPELKALAKKYSSSELALVSFSADTDQQAWKNFISKHDREWPQYWDGDGRIRNQFGVNAFPTYLVLDQAGFIRERIAGLNPQLTVVGRLKDALKAMLPE
jgi:thiol-disulfide isomerase/thioredoxin